MNINAATSRRQTQLRPEAFAGLAELTGACKSRDCLGSLRSSVRCFSRGMVRVYA